MILRPTLKTLRSLAPAYTWEAVRMGFGWQYRGRRGLDTIHVTPTSGLWLVMARRAQR